MKAPKEPPVIETEQQAIDFGLAMHKIAHFDPEWAQRVFFSDARIHYVTGAAELNAEISSMWRSFWTEDEKLRLYTAYIEARLRT